MRRRRLPRIGLLLILWTSSAVPCAAGALDPSCFRPGCGGTAEDAWMARQRDDFRRPAVRWRGAANESCLLAPGSLRDVVLTSRLTPKGQPAGFVFRHVDSEHYLGVYVDPRAGLAVAKEWDHDRARTVATVVFEAPRWAASYGITAAVAGDRVSVFVEGRRVLSATGASVREGAAGLLAGPLSEAEMDGMAFLPLPASSAAFVEPLVLPATPVGGILDVTPKCHRPDQPTEETGTCRWSIEPDSLPPGLGVTGSGGLVGSPSRAGMFDIPLTITVAGGGRPSHQSLPLDVDGVIWPRFPHDPASHRERSLAVTYTPDDVGPNISWEQLGRPDTFLFRLHRDHPLLRMTLTLCPENRYVRRVDGAVRRTSEQVWREIVSGPRLEWLELGGHGYAHSPDGDTNEDHHEFSITESGCNVDHAALGDRRYCERRFALARESMERAGVPQGALAVMRFPGVDDSPEARRAAAREGYLALLGSRHLDEPGRAWWTAYPGGEILEIQNLAFDRAFARSEELERALAEGSVRPDALRGSAPFEAALAKGRALVRRLETQGGIVNLSGHWWETFESVAGVMPRYLLLDTWLSELPAETVWWPSARELALWLELRRRAVVTWSRENHRVEIRLTAPPGWRPPAEGFRASIVALVPGGEAIVEVRRDGRPLPRDSWWQDGGKVIVVFPMAETVRLSLLQG